MMAGGGAERRASHGLSAAARYKSAGRSSRLTGGMSPLESTVGTAAGLASLRGESAVDPDLSRAAGPMLGRVGDWGKL